MEKNKSPKSDKPRKHYSKSKKTKIKLPKVKAPKIKIPKIKLNYKLPKRLTKEQQRLIMTIGFQVTMMVIEKIKAKDGDTPLVVDIAEIVAANAFGKLEL